MKLNKVAFAFAAGIVWGALVFLGTWWVVIRNGTGELISKLGRIYIGYSPSPSGSILGLIYGFVSAFIIGFIFAVLYNSFCNPAPAAEIEEEVIIDSSELEEGVEDYPEDAILDSDDEKPQE